MTHLRTDPACHYLTIETYGELHLRLVCTATPDADCRKRPTDPDQESWGADDPTLTDGHECWAVEWAEEADWEAVTAERDTEWPRIPVTVEYDEGVIVAPIAPPPALPSLETLAELQRLLDEARGRLSSPRRAGKTYAMDALRNAAVNALPALLAAATERDALAAAVDRARALHTPVRYYTDPCDDPECEREHVELSVGDYYHGDVFELMCEVCSGGDLSECDYDDAMPHPCPTRRALDATQTGGES